MFKLGKRRKILNSVEQIENISEGILPKKIYTILDTICGPLIQDTKKIIEEAMEYYYIEKVKLYEDQNKSLSTLLATMKQIICLNTSLKTIEIIEETEKILKKAAQDDNNYKKKVEDNREKLNSIASLTPSKRPVMPKESHYSLTNSSCIPTNIGNIETILSKLSELKETSTQQENNKLDTIIQTLEKLKPSMLYDCSLPPGYPEPTELDLGPFLLKGGVILVVALLFIIDKCFNNGKFATSIYEGIAKAFSFNSMRSSSSQNICGTSVVSGTKAIKLQSSNFYHL